MMLSFCQEKNYAEEERCRRVEGRTTLLQHSFSGTATYGKAPYRQNCCERIFTRPRVIRFPAFEAGAS